MSDKEDVSRRSLLRSATVAGAAVAATMTPPAMAPQSAQAQTPAAPAAPVVANAATASSGYTFLGPVDAAFFEAVADPLVPADELTPGGVDLGIAVFIDRALAGSWGKGDRLYAQGPWKLGTPNQGYQLPLTPAELFRSGVEQTNIYCAKTFGGKTFDGLTSQDKEQVLKGLETGTIKFESGLPSTVFFAEMYQAVMQGMFADPIYGGNRDKASWKMIGFPGVIEVNQKNIVDYRNKKFPTEPLSIADVG